MKTKSKDSILDQQMMHYLHQSLNERQTPESVAKRIKKLIYSDLDKNERKILNKAAERKSYSFMLEYFKDPVAPVNCVKVAEEVFNKRKKMSENDCKDPKKLDFFVKSLNRKIKKKYSHNSFLNDRLNKSKREGKNIGSLSRRKYNKMFRIISRLEKKIEKYKIELSKNRFVKVGHSGFAYDIDFQSFNKDINSACFVAYFVSRCNLRSVFTNKSQQRPYDKICEMLYKRCLNSKTTNWSLVAQVYSTKDVLSKLTQKEKGELLGKWFAILNEIAYFLKWLWDKNDINKQTMIVRSGNDSDTWNNTASAWNKARMHWINLVYDLNMDGLLDKICPGKVMRLIAGDVAYWHKESSGSDDLEINTYIWRELPLPWDVLSGKSECNRKIVKEICQRHNLHVNQSGWLGMTRQKNVESFSPTPELVHGVKVYCPDLAKRMRKSGAFSGNNSKENIEVPYVVKRDNHGFVKEVASS